MSDRFLCIVGGARERHAAMARQAEARFGWGSGWSIGPATLFFPGTTKVARSDQVGAVIIGSIYRGFSPQSDCRLSTAEWSGLLQSHGRSLLASHWGSWIAGTWDSDARVLRLLRDPSGALPCYYHTDGSMTVLASDVRDLERTGFLTPAVNWDVVSDLLVRPGHRGDATAIIGVSELLPGCMICVRPDEGRLQTRPIWSPWDFVGKGEPGGDEAAGLESLIDGVTAQMAGSSEHAILSLSGGLDSSLIAAALARAGGQTDCLTMVTGEAEGDESRFASQVAGHLGFPLISRSYDLGEIDLSNSSARHLPRPSARTFAQGADRFRNTYAEGRDAGLIFAGDGGDNVFCFLQSVLPVLDRLQADGPGKGLAATIRDISMLSRCSTITVARQALRRRLQERGYQWTANAHLLSPQAVHRSATVPMHPWLDAPRHAPPGKSAHVAMLVRSQLYHEAREPGAACMRLPLLAQPLLEYCLRIPTWKWCEGGHNRVIARRAYVDRLPASVLLRRTKGGADSFCVTLVDANVGVIRELLLDGMLAREGLIDPGAVAATLASPVRTGAQTHRLLALVDAEAWARSWVG